MRRTLSTVTATLAGFGAVLALHSASTKARPPSSSASSSTASGSTGSSAPPSSGPTTSGNGTASPQTAAPSSGPSRSVTGPAENYGYGILAVKVTVRDGRISDVTLAGIRVAESYSQMLAQQVVPILRHEVLSAQSARVNTISGATYTSEAYLASAQSAIAKAKA
jgi:uncharacterized protein with FMN-binding domain